MKFLALSLAALPVVMASPYKISSVADPDPTQVWVDSVTYGGTGCPQGTASISLAPDRKSFTVMLDAYVATTGPGFTITDARKNCQLNISLHYPGGFQWSVYSSDYRGYVELDQGVSG